MPTQVHVPGCTSIPCSFPQGSNIPAQIGFVAPNGALSLTVDVWLIVAGTHVIYELPPAQQNGCNNLSGAACPLGINQSATHNFEFQITAGTPISSASIEVSLINHAGETVYCAVLPVLITG